MPRQVYFIKTPVTADTKGDLSATLATLEPPVKLTEYTAALYTDKDYHYYYSKKRNTEAETVAEKRRLRVDTPVLSAQLLGAPAQ